MLSSPSDAESVVAPSAEDSCVSPAEDNCVSPAGVLTAASTGSVGTYVAEDSCVPAGGTTALVRASGSEYVSYALTGSVGFRCPTMWARFVSLILW